MITYAKWLESQQVTMFYEVTGKLPDGTVFQVQKKVVCENEKAANDLITEWNRLAGLTKEINYYYRRLG